MSDPKSYDLKWGGGLSNQLSYSVDLVMLPVPVSHLSGRKYQGSFPQNESPTSNVSDSQPAFILSARASPSLCQLYVIKNGNGETYSCTDLGFLFSCQPITP